jgi:TonB family C-terminal domain
MKQLLVLLALLAPATTHAQTLVDAGDVLYSINGADTTIIEKPPFAGRYMGKMPEASFNGDLKAYIAQHTVYPDSLKKKGISGIVELYFEIDTAGHIGEAVVISNTHYMLDDIALRMLRNMPPWQPAIMDGKAITSRAVIYVPFR